MRLSLLLVSLLLGSTTLAAGGAERSARRTSDSIRPVREVPRIPIDASTLNKVLRVHTAPNLPVYLMFPEGFAGTPSCGACVDGSRPVELSETDALFMITASAKDNYVSLKPLRRSREDGGDGPTAARFVTTLTVNLKSGVTLPLEIAYSEPDEVDTLVQFYFPDREGENAFVARKLAEEKQKLEADFSERVSAAAARTVQDLLLQSHECRPTSRRGRQDNALLEVEEVCRFGNRHFVVFSITNRGRSLLSVGDITVTRGKDALPPDDLYEAQLPKHELNFNDTVRGVLSFELPEGGERRPFELRMVENGGKNREVVVSDVSF